MPPTQCLSLRLNRVPQYKAHSQTCYSVDIGYYLDEEEVSILSRPSALLGVRLDMCKVHNYIMIDTSTADFIYNGYSNMAQYGQNILTNVYNHKLYR